VSAGRLRPRDPPPPPRGAPLPSARGARGAGDRVDDVVHFAVGRRLERVELRLRGNARVSDAARASRAAELGPGLGARRRAPRLARRRPGRAARGGGTLSPLKEVVMASILVTTSEAWWRPAPAQNGGGRQRGGRRAGMPRPGGRGLERCAATPAAGGAEGARQAGRNRGVDDCSLRLHCIKKGCLARALTISAAAKRSARRQSRAPRRQECEGGQRGVGNGARTRHCRCCRTSAGQTC